MLRCAAGDVHADHKKIRLYIRMRLQHHFGFVERLTAIDNMTGRGSQHGLDTISEQASLDDHHDTLWLGKAGNLPHGSLLNRPVT